MDLTTPEAVCLADDIEAAAAADLYAAAPAGFGMHARRVAGATVLVAPGMPVSYFNRVIGLGNRSAASERDLDECLAIFAAAGVADFWVHLSPAAAPPALVDWLHARGLRPPPRRSWAKFLKVLPGRDMPPTQPGPAVRPATAADAAEVGRTVSVAFDMPPQLASWFANLIGRDGWQVLVAEIEGRIGGVGALFVRERTAWLGIGATLPEYRRRGTQTALLAARLGAATAGGCSFAVTETGESVAGEPNPSLANIRRATFTQVCSRLNFASRA